MRTHKIINFTELLKTVFSSYLYLRASLALKSNGKSIIVL